MSTIALLIITGLGLGALYFLIAAGLSLIWGLMRVLNFAHGAFFTVAAYTGWAASSRMPAGSWSSWLVFLLVAIVTGAVLAALTETLLIRPLYARHVGQVLVTVGLALASVALIQGGFGNDPIQLTLPPGLDRSIAVIGANVPLTRFLVIAVAVLVLTALLLFLKRTRYGLIVRAGVENRAMVAALGIDVQRAFTLVFALGGAAAGLAGVLAGAYYGTIDPLRGTSMLIFAFIVVVIGGLGSVTGCAIAAVVVGILQQFLNFYAAAGVGDFAVVLLLAAVLLVRPGGLAGVKS